MRLTEQDKDNLILLTENAKNTTTELLTGYVNAVIGQVMENDLKELMGSKDYETFKTVKHDFYRDIAWMYIHDICTEEQLNHFKYIYKETVKVLSINRGWMI